MHFYVAKYWKSLGNSNWIDETKENIDWRVRNNQNEKTLIVSKDINPQNTIYFLGAQLLNVLFDNDGESDFISAFQVINNQKKISVSLFTLAVDWLFLLGLIELDQGIIRYVHKEP
jgi:hypothetical protein